MEKLIKVSEITKHHKFNYLRQNFQIEFDKSENPLTISKLSEFLELTLTILGDRFSAFQFIDYKVGTKLQLNSFDKPVHIEFLPKDNLNTILILDRISKLFQSGSMSSVDNVSLTFTVLGKR